MILLKQENFNQKIGGKQVELFTLKNKNGLVAQFSNYGARWLSFWVPTNNGLWKDIVLGFNSLEEYMNADEKYHGAIVGRVCGRIHNANFLLDGKSYFLDKNDSFGKSAQNHIHGGVEGLSFRVWTGKTGKNEKDESFLELNYLSKDRECGYPGNVDIKVRYTLQDDNALAITYTAGTDKPTLINLTNHAYFNLHGEGEGSILDHSLYINADDFIETDEDLIPTGSILPVKGTPVDFKEDKTIGSRLHQKYKDHLFTGEGYVVSYSLNQPVKGAINLAARLKEPNSGSVLEVYTDQPSLQFYTAFLFSGKDKGKSQQPYFSSGGLALEAQGFPDAIHHPGFPDIILRPGEVYRQETKYLFLIE